MVTLLLLRVHLWSWKNRILARLRRLRQIRYLLFTGLAMAWILSFWQPWRAGRLFPFSVGGEDSSVRIGGGNAYRWWRRVP